MHIQGADFQIDCLTIVVPSRASPATQGATPSQYTPPGLVQIGTGQCLFASVIAAVQRVPPTTWSDGGVAGTRAQASLKTFRFESVISIPPQMSCAVV
ncbi:hypothetical protein ALP75_203754 [Pseudomonas syringae pv. actinidiae]|nr:hypothetical protein ALP75_203754 [Pseudomonas syringae pv. actinidiae]